MVEDREEAVKIIGQNANTFYFVFCLHLCSEASKKNRLAKKKKGTKYSPTSLAVQLINKMKIYISLPEIWKINE